MNPIKTDINFTIKQINQIGGLATNILDNMTENYQYLNTDNGLYFETNDKDKNKNKKSNSNFNYLGNGTFTVVVSIKYIDFRGSNNNPKNWDDKFNDRLILRITEENSDNLIENNYKKDKPIFGENLLDIYLYGKLKIKLKDEDKEYYYTITREYNTNLTELNIYNKIKFIKSYFEVLILAHDNKIFYRDSKYENVGYDLDENICKFIILDYDEYTLVRIDAISEKDKIDTTKPFFHGTFPVYYAINYIFGDKDNIKNLPKNNYDKLYISGMIDILNKLLLNENNNITTFLNYCSTFVMIKNHINKSFRNTTTFKQFTEIQQKKILKIKDDLNAYNKNSIFFSEITLINLEQTISELFNFFIKDLIYDSLLEKYEDVKGIKLIEKKLNCINKIFISIINILENNQPSKNIKKMPEDINDLIKKILINVYSNIPFEKDINDYLEKNNLDKDSFIAYCITTKTDLDIFIHERLLYQAILYGHENSLKNLINFFNIDDNVKYHDLIAFLYIQGIYWKKDINYLYEKFNNVLVTFSPKDAFNLETTSSNTSQEYKNNMDKINNSLLKKLNIPNINNKLNSFFDGHVEKFNIIQISILKPESNIKLEDIESFINILELNPNINLFDKENFEKIKRAYKKKTLKYHPDRSKHLDEATRIIYEDNFKLISRIYKNIDDIVNPLKGGRYKKKYNKKYNKINKKT